MKTNKVVLSLILGIVYWFLAALFVRNFGSFFFTGQSPWLLVLFAASLPGSWLLIQNAKLLIRLKQSEIYDSVVIMTFIATLFDGIAITFFRPLYGPSTHIVMLGAAWILWGVGCGLLIGYVIKSRSNANTVEKPSAALSRRAVQIEP